MIKEIQYDYLSDHIIHVDFIRIDLNKPVEVEVPVVLLEGEPDRRQDRGRPAGVHPPRDAWSAACPPAFPRRSASISPACISASRSRWRTLAKTDAYQFISPANTVICAVAAKAKEEVVAVPEVAAAAEVAAEGAAAPAADAAGRQGRRSRKGAGKEGDKAAAPGQGQGPRPRARKSRRVTFLYSSAWATPTRNTRKHRTTPGFSASTSSAAAMASSWPGWEASCSSRKPASAARMSSWPNP